MFGERALIAANVRTQLADALAPAWRATLLTFDGARRAHAAAEFRQAFGADPEERVLLVATLDPFLVRVYLPAEDGAPGRVLTGCPASDFPDGGAALRAALLDTLAGALAGIGEDAAQRATRYAAAVGNRGGFVIAAHPVLGTIKVMLAKPGQDLSEALTLGDVGVEVRVH